MSASILWIVGAGDLPLDVQERISAVLPSLVSKGKDTDLGWCLESGQCYAVHVEGLLTLAMTLGYIRTLYPATVQTPAAV